MEKKEAIVALKKIRNKQFYKKYTIIMIILIVIGSLLMILGATVPYRGSISISSYDSNIYKFGKVASEAGSLEQFLFALFVLGSVAFYVVLIIGIMVLSKFIYDTVSASPSFQLRQIKQAQLLEEAKLKINNSNSTIISNSNTQLHQNNNSIESNDIELQKIKLETERLKLEREKLELNKKKLENETK